MLRSKILLPSSRYKICLLYKKQYGYRARDGWDRCPEGTRIRKLMKESEVLIRDVFQDRRDGKNQWVVQGGQKGKE
jgi:hypothetical protein